MAASRCHHIGIGISFPLDGERQDTGVRERDKSHQLPLSFPSRGRNSGPSPVALFIRQPMSRSQPISKEHTRATTDLNVIVFNFALL